MVLANTTYYLTSSNIITNINHIYTIVEYTYSAYPKPRDAAVSTVLTFIQSIPERPLQLFQLLGYKAIVALHLLIKVMSVQFDRYIIK